MSKNKNPKDNKDPEKIIMIVNGQPIEMCLKTLSLCNKRSQLMIKSMRKQSLAEMRTMRMFWGDIVMMNIITNQLLQKVNPLSLQRVLKPTNSLTEDLMEYRDTRKKQMENIKSAVIIAHNDSLPLDYSNELEKYYKEEFVDNTKDTEEKDKTDISDFLGTVPPKPKRKRPAPSRPSASKENISTASEERFETDASQRAKEYKQAKKETVRPTFEKHISYEVEDEEEVSFDSLAKSEHLVDDIVPASKEIKEKTIQIQSEPISDVKDDVLSDINIEDMLIPPQFDKPKSENPKEEKTTPINDGKTEFEKNKEAFATFDNIDIDALFKNE